MCFTFPNMDFDTEKFILEVKRREAIWNSEATIYKDRDMKWRQWEELVAMFGREKMSTGQKKHLANELQKKWKNIRDNFVKTRREITRNKCAVAKKPIYMYYNDLLFLKDTVNYNTTETKARKQDDKTDISTRETNDTDDFVPTQKKRKKTSVEAELVNVTDVDRIETKNDEEGDDRLFFMSLVSDFKKVPEHLRLRTKAQLINVIAEAQSCGRAQHCDWDPTGPFHASNIKGNKTYGRKNKLTTVEDNTETKQTAETDGDMSASPERSLKAEASGAMDEVDLFSDDLL